MFYIKIPFDSRIAAEIALSKIEEASNLFSMLEKDIVEEGE